MKNKYIFYLCLSILFIAISFTVSIPAPQYPSLDLTADQLTARIHLMNQVESKELAEHREIIEQILQGHNPFLVCKK